MSFHSTYDNLCPDRTAHGPHEWYWHHIFRRDCPGLVVSFCGHDKTHGPHWIGEHHDELCNGLGMAGRCKHGEQMLNECKPCEAEAPS